ncbi:MAG: ATP-binding protein [Kiritimatiellae bacterium]|nr:ATP-binding protein [Kiritimatiellia bacterium]
MEQDFEKLGAFYLGRRQDGDKDIVMYDSRHLTTHAMIVGMTGSGKTGLALSMMEEAAIDGVPAILIDPKGDLGNILLQFPDLTPADFRPWVDEADAKRASITVDELAEKTAKTWREGLAKWGQDGDRIRRLASSAEFCVFTPGDTTGRPLQILKSFDAPKGADEITLRDSIISSVSSLLGLVGVQADPVQSREHILLSAILYSQWKQGNGLTLEQIINFVATPPFAKIGVFDIEAFYPSKDRMKLAMQLNGLLASPGFSAWREGEPLNVASLLHAPDGRPRISVISIAHLSDAERMFFVTALLGETVSWMRRQTGTSSLRAILYMDEIFGYFPPTANPPSKAPMLTLLKQARAFGLGVVLSTQNPVDLDYKGLSNCGTWFIGRLQTDRDKQRVLDGLEGAAAESGSKFDRSAIDKVLSGLGKRVFLMRDAADDEPVVFETRWAMSYMRGPLSMAEIRSLIKPSASEMPSPFQTEPATAQASGFPSPFDAFPATATTQQTDSRTEETPPDIVATVRLHFVNAKTSTDVWETRYYRASLDAEGWPDWPRSEELDELPSTVRAISAMVAGNKVSTWQKTLTSYLYQECALAFWRDAESKLTSARGETEGEFRVRVAQARREARDAAVEKIRETYRLKLQRAGDAMRRADDKIEREKAMAKQKKAASAISWGTAILGSILGGVASVGNVRRVGSAVRSSTMIGKKNQDVAQAEESAEILHKRYEALQAECEEALKAAHEEINPAALALDSITVRPRKTDILVERIAYA